MIQKSYKNSPKKILEEIKKRRQTINITQSEYNLPEKIRSPKTQKKQSYFIKDLKNSHKYDKSNKIMYTESKKSQRVNSLTPYENDLTPKKLLFYHIDSSQQKQKCVRKIHSISLVDTPKKLNLKKKTQQHLFTVKEQKDKQGCKKIISSSKFSSKNLTKPLKLQSAKLYDSRQQQDTTPSSNMRSSNKFYSKNCDNYDIYYNEGANNSSSHLKSSKKISTGESGQMQKQKSSSRTLRITRNSRSSNHNNNLTNNLSNNLSIGQSNKNIMKSQKGIKATRIESIQIVSPSTHKLHQKKYEKIFLKCSLVLKKYNTELEKLKGQNQSLKQQNEYLKSSLSQRAL